MNSLVFGRSGSSLSSEKQSKMATVMPGDIKTEPHAKIVYNAPFTEKNRYHLTIANLGAHRMGWAIKTTNMKRLSVDPPAGVLDPKEQQMLFVTCEDFSYETEDTNNDRITFEWTNAPEGAAKTFRREWFQGDGMIRRKNIPIEYNP